MPGAGALAAPGAPVDSAAGHGGDLRRPAERLRGGEAMAAGAAAAVAHGGGEHPGGRRGPEHGGWRVPAGFSRVLAWFYMVLPVFCIVLMPFDGL